MRSELSDRERTVLEFATKGFTDDMIARELGIEKGTVNSYWVRIRGKQGHFSRTELVARYVQSNANSNHRAISEAHAVETNGKAADQKVLLDKANAEIEHLKELLKKRKG